MEQSNLEPSKPERLIDNAGSSIVHGFPPVARTDARCLILGSMPGVASLRAGEYYAHPRNLFWQLIGERIGASAKAAYSERLQRLTSAGIALWDVLGACAREGSLDADIESGTQQPNDFGTFFAAHPQIRRVLFNGVAAERCFARLVLPSLPAAQTLQCIRLPSSSPANAAIPYLVKCQAWDRALA